MGIQIGATGATGFKLGSSQIAKIYSGNNIVWPNAIGPGNLLLDQYPGAEFAYGFSQLSTTYKGPIVQVKRVSDGELKNIYPLANGQLDTVTLLTFIGAGDGNVEILYDQSGNNRYMNTTNPVPIVDTGALITDANGYMGCRFGNNTGSPYMKMSYPEARPAINYYDTPTTIYNTAAMVTPATTKGSYWGMDYSSGIGGSLNDLSCNYDFNHNAGGIPGYVNFIQNQAGVGQRLLTPHTAPTNIIETSCSYYNKDATNAEVQIIIQNDTQVNHNIDGIAEYIGQTTQAYGINPSGQSEWGSATIQLYSQSICYINQSDVDRIAVQAFIVNQYDPAITPVADFSGSPTTNPIPLNVTFTDLSTNTPTSWLWDFGDGATAGTQNPTHTYGATGDYTVSLTATNFGGSDVEVKIDYITATAYIPPPAPPTPLLDLYSSNVWWSVGLRKNRAAYAGPAIQVRRSSDNALQDIGFVDGLLDTISLLNFIGVNTGYIEIWYDQSGSANDFITTGDFRPIIVDAGNLIIDGPLDRPAIKFNDARLRSATQLFAYMTTPIVTKKIFMTHGSVRNLDQGLFSGIATSKKAADDLAPAIAFSPTSPYPLRTSWRGSAGLDSTFDAAITTQFSYYCSTTLTENGNLSGTAAQVYEKFYKNSVLDNFNGPITQLYAWISPNTEIGTTGRVGNNPVSGSTIYLSELSTYYIDTPGTDLTNDASGIGANIMTYIGI